MKASSMNSPHAAATCFAFSLQRAIFQFALKNELYRVVSKGTSTLFNC